MSAPEATGQGQGADTAGDATRARCRAALAGLAFDEPQARDGMLVLRPAPADTRAVLQGLRDGAGFETITLVTAVDHLPRTPRFVVVHQLLSLRHKDRVRVETTLADEDPQVDSCVALWPGASFMERECYDLFGIVFSGHPDLRRLLMPEGYGHHPLRKDFPQQGIQPDRLYREWDAARRQGWDAATGTPRSIAEDAANAKPR